MEYGHGKSAVLKVSCGCLHKIKPITGNLLAWVWDPLLLAKELLTVDGFQGRESQISLTVWLLICQPSSHGWHHIQKYVGSTTWSRYVINSFEQEDTKLGWKVSYEQTGVKVDS